MIREIEYKGYFYPEFQTTGNAARFIMPFAIEVCEGIGYDIGYHKLEWKFPGAIGIDIDAPGALEGYSGDNLPEGKVDYIFSSHCLEHMDDWVAALDHWISRIKPGGVLFLYLPHFEQEYWRPWNNRKHKHAFTPKIINAYFKDNSYVESLYSSKVDLNSSFAIMATIR